MRPDLETIKAIIELPVPVDVKGLKKALGLAAYLHKYSRNYAEMTVHLSRLLKIDEKWFWNADCQRSFKSIKQSLMQSPILAIADQDNYRLATLVDVKGLRKLLGLAAYLHKNFRNYAEMTVHLSRLLKKDEKWL